MGAIKVSHLFSRRRAAAAAAACALVVGGAAIPDAFAQEPGVVYEPGSPSAKEYAIPLEEAREDAGGARPGPAGARAFGIGISPARKGQGPSRDGDSRGSLDRGKGGRQTGDGRSARGGSGSDALEERLADAEAAGAPALWRLVPLLLVLLPGLLVGLLLARRGAQRPVAT